MQNKQYSVILALLVIAILIGATQLYVLITQETEVVVQNTKATETVNEQATSTTATAKPAAATVSDNEILNDKTIFFAGPRIIIDSTKGYSTLYLEEISETENSFIARAYDTSKTEINKNLGIGDTTAHIYISNKDSFDNLEGSVENWPYIHDKAGYDKVVNMFLNRKADDGYAIESYNGRTFVTTQGNFEDLDGPSKIYITFMSNYIVETRVFLYPQFSEYTYEAQQEANHIFPRIHFSQL